MARDFALGLGFLLFLVLLPSTSGATDTSGSSAALESLGEFRFQEFSLAPRLDLREPSQGGFELKDSWISVRWTKQDNVIGEIRIGTLDSLQAPVWFTPRTSPRERDLGLIEAWIELRSHYGVVRAGQIAIPDGLEGVLSDGFWLLPPSLVKQKHWTFNRDQGLSFQAETKPWLTQIVVHNGEADANQDNKIWVTGRWQYFANATGDGVLLTATEGSTNPSSTLGSLAAKQDLFRYDPSLPAKVRYGTVSVFHLWRRNFYSVEYGRGDILQWDDKAPFAWGRAELSWNWSESSWSDLNTLIRAEQLQSDLKSSESMQKAIGFGFLISSRDQLGSVLLFANHKEESPSVNNDELSLVFRLNSTSLGH